MADIVLYLWALNQSTIAFNFTHTNFVLHLSTKLINFKYILKPRRLNASAKNFIWTYFYVFCCISFGSDKESSANHLGWLLGEMKYFRGVRSHLIKYGSDCQYIGQYLENRTILYLCHPKFQVKAFWEMMLIFILSYMDTNRTFL